MARPSLRPRGASGPTFDDPGPKTPLIKLAVPRGAPVRPAALPVPRGGVRPGSAAELRAFGLSGVQSP